LSSTTTSSEIRAWFSLVISIRSSATPLDNDDGGGGNNDDGDDDG
jgi:hypothetical protein